MNPELFIVRKIAFSSSKSFSAFIIRIAMAAVALSLATMIIATAMVNGFQKEIRNKIFGFWSHLQIVPSSLTNSLNEDGVYRYEDFYKDKNLIPEATNIQVTALKGGLLKTGDDFEEIILKGAGDDFDWKNFESYLKGGTPLNFGDSSKPEIIVSKYTADRLRLKLDDKVIVNFLFKNSQTARRFYVQGIYETGMEEFDKKFALVDIASIQELNNWGSDTVGGFEVFLPQENLFKSRWNSYFLILFGAFLSEEKFSELNSDPIDDVASKIYLSNPKLEVRTIKTQYPGIFDWLNLQTMNELIILLLMVVVAVINMITAMLILILERTNMIGILKALGAQNVSIRRIFLYYSAVIIGTGLLLGNFFGIGLCLLQKYFHLIKLPQESYYLTYAPADINFAWILFLNLGTIAVTLLLLLIPSMLVSRISPVKTIRFE